jgi:hypothetical protein
MKKLIILFALAASGAWAQNSSCDHGISGSIVYYREY